MFGLFKKKEKGPLVIEKIVISETAKLKLMQAYWGEQPNTVFVFWFDDSAREAEKFFTENGTPGIPILTARETGTGQLAGRNPVFGEHHPLPSREIALYDKLQLDTVITFSSLNEPLFKRFGADKIIQMMKQFGMKEDEVIEHKLITSAIRNAQDKIGKKVTIEQSANSQKDWIEKNLPAE